MEGSFPIPVNELSKKNKIFVRWVTLLINSC